MLLTTAEISTTLIDRAMCRIRVALLTIAAWNLLVVYDILIVLGGFALVHRVVRACPVMKLPMLRSPEQDVCLAVREAAFWYFKRAFCLQRSATTVFLLRFFHVNAALVIGFRPADYESHAWVEVSGRIVNDRPQYSKVFTVLERL